MFKRPLVFAPGTVGRRHYRFVLVLWLALVTTANAAGRYTVSADGLEVSDTQTNLVWRRAPEPGLYTYQQALQQAADQAASTGIAWRLPNVKELSSLVDRSIANPGPTIDVSAFPDRPANYFWSSSPFADSAWYVDFSFGFVEYSPPGVTVTLAVQLVRAGQ